MTRRELLARLASATDQISALPFFCLLREGVATEKQIAEMVSQYAYITAEFPQVLCTLGSRLNSDEARLGVITNLWDEHGQGDIERSHRRMFSRFLRAADLVHASEVAMPTPQTESFRDSVNRIVAAGSVSEAIGCILFFEAVTPSEYAAVINWFRKRTTLELNDLEFWIDHIDHDGRHAASLLDLTVLHEPVEYLEISQGIDLTQTAEEKFWSQF